jgi:REP element-mobilizing transposase RayT
MPRRRRPQQLELPLKSTWGGKRRNAGRKPGPHPKTPHRARPRHYFGHPVHVTLRARLGSLRSQFLYPTVRLAISRATRHAPDRFRIVHYSVQSNHVHLICEAAERRALTAGVHGLETRITRYVNQLLYRVVAPSGPTAGTAARSSPRVKCATRSSTCSRISASIRPGRCRAAWTLAPRRRGFVAGAASIRSVGRR